MMYTICWISTWTGLVISTVPTQACGMTQTEKLDVAIRAVEQMDAEFRPIVQRVKGNDVWFYIEGRHW